MRRQEVGSLTALLNPSRDASDGPNQARRHLNRDRGDGGRLSRRVEVTGERGCKPFHAGCKEVLRAEQAFRKQRLVSVYAAAYNSHPAGTRSPLARRVCHTALSRRPLCTHAEPTPCRSMKARLSTDPRLRTLQVPLTEPGTPPERCAHTRRPTDARGADRRDRRVQNTNTQQISQHMPARAAVQLTSSLASRLRESGPRYEEEGLWGAGVQ